MEFLIENILSLNKTKIGPFFKYHGSSRQTIKFQEEKVYNLSCKYKVDAI